MPDFPNLSEAAYAAAGVAATGFFGLIGNWLMTRKAREERKQKAEETLAEVVDARIRLILEEARSQVALRDGAIADRDKQITDLKAEVRQLHAKLGSLVTIVRKMLQRATACAADPDADCQLRPSELATQLADALAMSAVDHPTGNAKA